MQSLNWKHFNLLSEESKKPSDISMCLNDTKYKGFERNVKILFFHKCVIYCYFSIIEITITIYNILNQLFNIFFSFLYTFVICVFVIFSIFFHVHLFLYYY